MSDKTELLAEAALEEEMIYIIANLAAAEEHAIESARQVKDLRFVSAIADACRMLRQTVSSLIFPKKELSREGQRTMEGEAWCIFKHLLLVKVHTMESIQKYAREKKDKEIEILLDVLNGNEYLLHLIKEVLKHGGFRTHKEDGGRRSRKDK